MEQFATIVSGLEQEIRRETQWRRNLIHCLQGTLQLVSEVRAAGSARFASSFWRWFTGSRVIEPSGAPSLQYHGTDADFDVFELSEDIGFHFGTLATAVTRIKQAKMLEPRILPVYLAIRNPLRLPDLHTWAPSRVLDELLEAEVLDADQADAVELVDRETVAAFLSAKGYDGIVYANDTEGGGDSYIVFEPTQIKSVLNSGAFDPLDSSFLR